MPENIDESLLPHLSAFERIKHLDKDGREWWSARELMLLLTYSKWQDFHKVIQAAIEVYQNSGGEDADAIFMAKLSRLCAQRHVNNVNNEAFLRKKTYCNCSAI
jgi:hypothetical protein